MKYEWRLSLWALWIAFYGFGLGIFTHARWGIDRQPDWYHFAIPGGGLIVAVIINGYRR